MVERGEKVLVRTFGGYPCVRKLWTCEHGACLVAEDAAYERLMLGDFTGAVGVPIEDVFVYSPEVGDMISKGATFDAWDTLKPVRESMQT